MAERPKIKITGKTGVNYDMDIIEEGGRDNSTKELLVQIHEYSVTEDPNPSKIKRGQIWLSVRK